MSDITTGEQPLTGAAGTGGLGGQSAARPLTFSEALSVWEICKHNLEESRQDYLSCKNFGNAASQFTAAVILAEAFCMSEEAREKYEEIADAEYHAMVQAERDARDGDALRAAIQEELEHAS